MKLSHLSVLAAMIAASTLSASAEDLVAITSVPEGGTVEMYDRAGTGSYKDGFSIATKEYSGLATELVTYADGKVYWKNPVSQVAASSNTTIQAVANTYIQGTISGNTMTFTLPQYVGQLDDGYGNMMDGYVMIFDNPSKYSADKGANQVLTFTKNADGAWVMDGTSAKRLLGLGGYLSNFELWQYQSYGDYNVTLTPAAAGPQAVEMPTGATIENWVAKYNYTGKTVEVCVVDNEIYVRGLFPTAPQATFKGTIANGQVTIESGQYMGLSATGTKIYLGIATQEEKTDPTTERTVKYYAPVTSAQFTYDAAARCLTVNKYLMATENPDAAELTPATTRDAIDSPVICYQGEVTNFVPATPTLERYSFRRGEGQVQFNLPAYNTEGQLIDTSNLYYRIFINSAVLEFSTANGYQMISTPMQDVPYSFDDAYDIDVNGALHSVYLFQSTTPTFVGVQAMYKVSDSQWEKSDVLAAFGTIPADLSTGIEAVTTDSDNVATYYDLQGRKVANPEAGLFIKVTGNKATKVVL